MPPAIIAAAVGLAAAGAAAAGYIALTTALVITIGASVAGTLLSKTKVPSLGAYTSQQERKQVLRSATAPMVTIYGRTVVSGLLFFAEEESGDSEKEWLHMAIALTGHEIDSIGRIWLGDDLIETYSSVATYELHNNRQTADPFMLANCQSWKDDMIGKGIAWLRLSLKFDQEKFPSGLPNVQVEVYGKKVYDPRTGGVAWSDNAALCILDYYRSHLEVPDADLNMSQFIQAANVADEITETPSGGRKRYTINGAFDASDAQATVLDDMHLACAGEPTFMAGMHGMFIGAYLGGGNNMSITEGQIVSDVKIVPEASYAEKINIVTGTFLDPEQKFTEVDFPQVRVESYIEQDGGEYTDDLKLRFVANEYQAQQLAQIKINRTRIGRKITFTMNMSGYRYRPGYYINLYLPVLGINGQEFRITDWQINPEKGVDITLKQETAAVWGDAIGQPIDRPDITDFPVNAVAPPTNLQYAVQDIGEVVQGVLSWNNTGQIIYNVVNVRQNGKIVLSIQVPGTSTPLTGLKRGSYEIGVAAVNAIGARSVEAFTIIEIHAPDKPVSVEVGQGFFSITLKPKLAQITNVSTQFDFWTSGETKLKDSLTTTVESNATRMGIGNLWTSEGLLNEHTYYWYVRSINAFGVSDFLEVAAVVSSDIGELMDYVDSAIKNTGTFKNLAQNIDVSIDAMLQNALANDATVDHQYALYGEVRADILIVKTTIADVDKAMASLETTVQAQGEGIDTLTGQIGSVTATVNEKMTATVKSDGTASAYYDLGLQILRGTTYYKAGMAMGIEPSGASYKSTILFSADQLGVYSGGNPGAYKLAFAVYNGQTFIADAMIRDASITNAKIANGSIDRLKITNYIQSDNYVANTQGMAINFVDGSFAMNGNVPGQGRLVLTNLRIISYDQDGNISAVMGLRV